MSNNQEYCKIKLTQDDKLRLDIFLLMTTNYRERELEAWQELSKEKKEDGTPAYKNASGNAKWWNDLCDSISRIKDALDHCEYIQEETKTIEQNDIDICE